MLGTVQDPNKYLPNSNQTERNTIILKHYDKDFSDHEQMLLEKRNTFLKIYLPPAFDKKKKDVVAKIATVQSN